MSQSDHQGIAAHITVIDGQPTTTTQDIAEVYGKRHDHILRIVRQRMAEAPEAWRLSNFGETVTERPSPINGAPIQSPVIRMTKKGFHFVVGKFTGAKAVQHQIAFADEFERMADELAGLGIVHTPSIDPRGLMLSGQTALKSALPPEVAHAIQAKAWDMAREAFDLAREHLERKVAYHAEIGLPPAVNSRLARRAIEGSTLGQALTHAHNREMHQTLKMMRITADIHRAAIEQTEKHMQALGITPVA